MFAAFVYMLSQYTYRLLSALLEFLSMSIDKMFCLVHLGSPSRAVFW